MTLACQSRRERRRCASGGHKTRLTKIFNDLAEHGKIKGSLTQQPWGDHGGWPKDKFGIDCMVSIDKA